MHIAKDVEPAEVVAECRMQRKASGPEGHPGVATIYGACPPALRLLYVPVAACWHHPCALRSNSAMLCLRQLHSSCPYQPAWRMPGVYTHATCYTTLYRVHTPGVYEDFAWTSWLCIRQRRVMIVMELAPGVTLAEYLATHYAPAVWPALCLAHDSARHDKRQKNGDACRATNSTRPLGLMTTNLSLSTCVRSIMRPGTWDTACSRACLCLMYCRSPGLFACMPACSILRCCPYSRTCTRTTWCSGYIMLCYVISYCIERYYIIL